MPGMFKQTEEKMQNHQGLNLKAKPHAGAQLCKSLDFCAGLSQNKIGYIYKLETVFFQDYIKDQNWTSVILLSSKTNQLKDNDSLDLDLCCPEQPRVPFINIGRREVPMQVRYKIIL